MKGVKIIRRLPLEIIQTTVLFYDLLLMTVGRVGAGFKFQEPHCLLTFEWVSAKVTLYLAASMEY